jgi:hypothetical protein
VRREVRSPREMELLVMSDLHVILFTFCEFRDSRFSGTHTCLHVWAACYSWCDRNAAVGRL